MPTPNTTTAATPAVPAAAAPAVGYDAFDEAFKELSTAEDAAATTAAAAPAIVEGAEDAVIPTPVVAVSADGAAPVVPASGVVTPEPVVDAGTPATPTPAPEPVAAVVPDVAAELAAARARIAELEAAKPATPEPVVPVVDTPAAETPIEWYKPTESETAALKAYKEQWPEVFAFEETRSKVQTYNTMQYMFAEIARTYGPVLAHLNEIADATTDFMSLTDLRRDHEDYDDVLDKVGPWVETLPEYARLGAQEIMKTGTPKQVSGLVADYKKANPTTAVPVVVGAAVAAPKAVTELSPAAKKAASKLTVVDSKRTTQTQAADPSDFEAAWREASAS